MSNKNLNKFMKTMSLFSKLWLVLFLCVGLSVESQTINREWAAKINQTFAGIDKSKVPHGILKDYAMEFTDVTAYNGVLTDSTFINTHVMGNKRNTCLKTSKSLTRSFSYFYIKNL